MVWIPVTNVEEFYEGINSCLLGNKLTWLFVTLFLTRQDRWMDLPCELLVFSSLVFTSLANFLKCGSLI